MGSMEMEVMMHPLGQINEVAVAAPVVVEPGGAGVRAHLGPVSRWPSETGSRPWRTRRRVPPLIHQACFPYRASLQTNIGRISVVAVVGVGFCEMLISPLMASIFFRALVVGLEDALPAPKVWRSLLAFTRRCCIAS